MDDAPARGDWVVNAPRPGLRDLSLVGLWKYRELAWMLAVRDVRSRYKQAVLGAAWAVLQPLVTVAVFIVVFRDLAGVNTGETPYIAFALAGTVAWAYLAGSITAATGSMVGNAPLLTKVYFPRIIGPLAAIVPPLVPFGVGVVLLGVVMAAQSITPGVALVLVPLTVAWMVVAAVGPGLLLGALNVRYRDVGAVQATFMQLWLLATPVAYPSALVDEQWRAVYWLNPAAGPVEAFRAVTVGGEFSLRQALVSAASGLAILVLAVIYFQRHERQFADVV